MTWIVWADPPKSISSGWDFKSDYFPRKFAYKKEALICQKEAEGKGGRNILVQKYSKYLPYKYNVPCSGCCGTTMNWDCENFPGWFPMCLKCVAERKFTNYPNQSVDSFGQLIVSR